MRILTTQYSIQYRALEIYLSGCSASPKCDDCHNPESWDFNVGDKIDFKLLSNLVSKVEDFPSLVYNIFIMGGEPLDQDPEEFLSFIMELQNILDIDINFWLFTRYEIGEIPHYIYPLFDYIKTGRYVRLLKTDNHKEHGISLASLNQHVYKKGLNY